MLNSACLNEAAADLDLDVWRADSTSSFAGPHRPPRLARTRSVYAFARVARQSAPGAVNGFEWQVGPIASSVPVPPYLPTRHSLPLPRACSFTGSFACSEYRLTLTVGTGLRPISIASHLPARGTASCSVRVELYVARIAACSRDRLNGFPTCRWTRCGDDGGGCVASASGSSSSHSQTSHSRCSRGFGSLCMLRTPSKRFALSVSPRLQKPCGPLLVASITQRATRLLA